MISTSDLFCRQTSVQASDVVITGTRDTSSGLQVQFYVRGMRGGVIPASAAVSAIQVSLRTVDSTSCSYKAVER